MLDECSTTELHPTLVLTTTFEAHAIVFIFQVRVRNLPRGQALVAHACNPSF
jgi:hypothetical protein